MLNLRFRNKLPLLRPSTPNFPVTPMALIPKTFAPNNAQAQIGLDNSRFLPPILPSCLHEPALPHRADSLLGGTRRRRLSLVCQESTSAVPALIRALSDTNRGVRVIAVDSLASFGTNAEMAVPSLIQSLTDQDSIVRTHAADALKAIDPEAAAKAGTHFPL
jgi:HEAT repeats